MPRVRDLLLRFRPSGAPGRAGPAGVPTDLSERWSTELGPLFAALAVTEGEYAAIAREGRRQGAESRAAMIARADALRADLHERVEAERATAAAAAHDAGRKTSAAFAGETEDQVAVVMTRAEALMPRYLDQVSAAVEALCVKPPGGSP